MIQKKAPVLQPSSPCSEFPFHSASGLSSRVLMEPPRPKPAPFSHSVPVQKRNDASLLHGSFVSAAEEKKKTPAKTNQNNNNKTQQTPNLQMGMVCKVTGWG